MNRLLRRTLYAGSAALAGAVLWGAQSASADDGTDQVQEAVVDNSTTQDASAVVDSAQLNVSSPVSVGGVAHDHQSRLAAPMAGDDGGGGSDVTQSNSADNSASAENSNDTIQDVAQGQGSSSVALDGYSSAPGQDQVADVINTTSQWAEAEVDNGQANVSVPVSVGGGGGGDVTQSNSADNSSTASNDNITDQFVAQGQGASSVALGGATGGGGQAQDAIVDNWTGQDASADVDNGQLNVSVPVSVGGGGGGDVTQSNSADNSATASNDNITDQFVEQAQAGSGSGSGSGQAQSATVDNATDQSAYATVSNGQYNVYAPVSVFSPGAGSGNVTQSNSATNEATAENANATFQGVAQGQAASGGGSWSGQDQSVSLYNSTDQSAGAAVYNGQANIYAPVSVFSPGAGGDVTQSNTASNDAAAGNDNETEQAALQEQAGSGSGSGQEQSATVDNATDQSAYSTVSNGQYNIYAPVSVFSPGAGGGSVTQSNSATNTATARNSNTTFQGVLQGQAASGGGSGQRQSAYLFNTTYQSANANVYNAQANIHAPVAVFSPGAGSGSVHQSNTADNSASASNSNRAFQLLLQGAASRSLRL